MELLPIALTHLAGFLLFIWVIKKYAVGPVMGVLDERRERIASQFDQVDAAEKRVTALRDEYEKRIEGIDEEAHRRMTEEVNRGRRIAEEIAENARREAANIIQSTRSNIQIQIDQARVQIKDEVIALTLAAAEKMIKERLDTAKHREMIGAFIDELGQH